MRESVAVAADIRAKLCEKRKILRASGERSKIRFTYKSGPELSKINYGRLRIYAK